jgi:general stress protein 26
VERFPVVTMAFANTGSNKYVSVTGHATVSEDRAKIKELWSPMAKAWWDSADDPAIRLITVKPDDAELWDSPNRFVATVAMLTAAVTGSTPAVGDNKKVTM